MATPTYTPIASYTFSSNAASYTFSSIPSTYTDLVLVINGGQTVATANSGLQFNGDTGNNYSSTYLRGTGSTVSSGRASNENLARIDGIGWPTSNSANCIVQIQNYSNTTTYKTVLSRMNSAAYGAETLVSLWRSTSAINQIVVKSEAYNWLSGTTFTLYGIANAAIGAPKATGGIITYDNTYYYHTFGASGTFTPQQSLTADILVVAGGGGGSGAGGGAGGLLGFASQSLSATGYTVTVGSGGAGQNNVGSNGTTGGDSQFGSLTLVKGGGGGAKQDGTGAGQNGGSGGGGAYASATGSATSGQGNAGGGSTTSGQRGNGGGGGAGAAGTAGTSTGGGAGGDGVSTYSSYGLITGTGQNVSGTVYYAGGGGGGNFSSDSTADTNGIGGLGGGGSAPSTLKTAGTAGLVNTGGGGSGASDGPNPTVGSVGGNGGSGVVIVRYLKA